MAGWSDGKRAVREMWPWQRRRLRRELIHILLFCAGFMLTVLIAEVLGILGTAMDEEKLFVTVLVVQGAPLVFAVFWEPADETPLQQLRYGVIALLVGTGINLTWLALAALS